MADKPRGLTPVLEALRSAGCPSCGEVPSRIQVHGPDAIVLEDCVHVLDAMEWADVHHQPQFPEGDEVK